MKHLILIFGVALVASAQSVTPSPDKRIVISAYVPGDPVFDQVPSFPLQQAFVVLANNSDTAVISAGVTLRGQAPSGKPRSLVLTCDAKLSLSQSVVIAPHSRTLLGPGHCITEQMALAWQSSGHIGGGAVRMFDQNSNFSIALSSVEFQGGERLSWPQSTGKRKTAIRALSGWVGGTYPWTVDGTYSCFPLFEACDSNQLFFARESGQNEGGASASCYSDGNPETYIGVQVSSCSVWSQLSVVSQPSGEASYLDLDTGEYLKADKLGSKGTISLQQPNGSYAVVYNDYSWSDCYDDDNTQDIPPDGNC